MRRAILVILPIFAILLSFYFRLPYLLSIILFYFLPGLYTDNINKSSNYTFKHLIFATIIALPFAIIVDYIGAQSGLWHVPRSIFPNRFLGVIPYEDFVWMIAGTYTMISLYAYNPRGREKNISIPNRRIEWFEVWSLIALFTFFVCTLFLPTLFVWHTRYAYVILGAVFFLLPALALFLTRSPFSIQKIIPVVGWFFYFTFLFEITGTSLQYWVFKGIYLFPPFVFGSALVPYEELFFVGVIGPIAAIAFYEYFGKRSISRV